MYGGRVARAYMKLFHLYLIYLLLLNEIKLVAKKKNEIGLSSECGRK